MHRITIPIKRLPHSAGLPLPEYATVASAGMDLAAAISEPTTLEPGARAAIPTGLCVAIPTGYEGQVRPRSGLALRHGIGMVNAPGTIDADYRGELRVILVNHGNTPVTINRGDRIAQMVVAPVAGATWDEVDELPATSRGSGGFGHTGL
ncbi:MAG: dUTP diphosphatase [Armatimonadetes bacterium]|nr:dUTP diphosphatase [Armatimonadota bacterium]